MHYERMNVSVTPKKNVSFLYSKSTLWLGLILVSSDATRLTVVIGRAAEDWLFDWLVDLLLLIDFEVSGFRVWMPNQQCQNIASIYILE